MSLPWAYCTAVCILICAAGYTFAKQRAKAPLPPGPARLPILGNALNVPFEFQWLKFTEWAGIYGEIFSLSVLGHSILVLNSVNAIEELFEKRSALYADRPHIPLAGEMVGFSSIPVLERYGRRHREGRKLILNSLDHHNQTDIHRIQRNKAALMLSKLVSNPKDRRSHSRWFIAAVVFQLTHGQQIEHVDHIFVKLAERFNKDFSHMVRPGRFLVDNIPILQYLPSWLPGMGFKSLAKECREQFLRLCNEPYAYVKDQVANGTALPSLAARLIEENTNPTPEEEWFYKTTVMQFYAAGADTTVSSIESFVLIMSLYPEIQQKAQAELDCVVGPGRLPDFSDGAYLPYLDAVLKEVYRWNPVLPISVPHRVMQDDVYNGFHIPIGATVIANSWAVLHDPLLYPDPFQVIPERYLNQEGGLNPDPQKFAFGYGRRVCPGRVLAEDSIFIFVACVLATLDISKAVGPDGLPIESGVQYTGGTVSHPGPFQCTIKPRSAESVCLIQSAAMHVDYMN
uniref:Cytochrome P450 n=1 Tax=Rhodonia placenta TaxID=104341 RepID=F1SYE4_9APHY|nr:cytochrome P450 [Postia placenta]